MIDADRLQERARIDHHEIYGGGNEGIVFAIVARLAGRRAGRLKIYDNGISNVIRDFEVVRSHHGEDRDEQIQGQADAGYVWSVSGVIDPVHARTAWRQ